MIKNQIKVIFISILGLLLLAGGLFYYFYYYQPAVNYLILGVPYYGVYNYFFNADSSVVTSVADILSYWGDERFNLSGLMKIFIRGQVYTTLDLERFFQSNGYETYRWASNEPGGEIAQIKKFINPKKKIPVIVYQKLSLDNQRFARGFRVVIGIFDRDKKLIVHDHDFGNNFEVSYRGFQEMFQPNARAILAVWPSEDLTKDIKGPDFNKTYPQRLAVMDKVGELLVKGADSLMFYYRGDYENTVQLHREFVNDPNFNYFPPAHRIIMYGFLVKNWLYLSSTTPAAIDEVVSFINNQMLPLNNNLSEPYDGWTEQTEFFKTHNYTTDKFAQPYYFLGLAYLYKDNKELAKKNFEEALKISPDHIWSQRELDKLK